MKRMNSERGRERESKEGGKTFASSNMVFLNHACHVFCFFLLLLGVFFSLFFPFFFHSCLAELRERSEKKGKKGGRLILIIRRLFLFCFVLFCNLCVLEEEWAALAIPLTDPLVSPHTRPMWSWANCGSDLNTPPSQPKGTKGKSG